MLANIAKLFIHNIDLRIEGYIFCWLMILMMMTTRMMSIAHHSTRDLFIFITPSLRLNSEGCECLLVMVMVVPLLVGWRCCEVGHPSAHSTTRTFG